MWVLNPSSQSSRTESSGDSSSLRTQPSPVDSPGRAHPNNTGNRANLEAASMGIFPAKRGIAKDGQRKVVTRCEATLYQTM